MASWELWARKRKMTADVETTQKQARLFLMKRQEG